MSCSYFLMLRKSVLMEPLIQLLINQIMKNISILGCGWLGFPLAETLFRGGYLVKGSTTSKEKIHFLGKTGIKPFQIVLKDTEITGEISSFLEKAEILIIDIPPKLRGDKKKASRKNKPINSIY